MLLRFVDFPDAGQAQAELQFRDAPHRRGLRDSLVKLDRLVRLLQVFGDAAEHHEDVGAVGVEPAGGLQIERNDILGAVAIERSTNREEHGRSTLAGILDLLFLRNTVLYVGPQRLQRRVVVDHVLADGDGIERLLLVAFARLETSERFDRPHEGVRRSTSAFPIQNGIVEPGPCGLLVARGNRDRACMIVLEHAEPVGALQAVDLCQRFLRLALAELRPGGKQAVHQPVEIVGALVVEELLRIAILALADRFDRADHGGDALDGRV
ncbi:hypothetical protein D9M72_424260 [compost metagenome]